MDIASERLQKPRVQPDLSIVIPVLNAAAALPGTLGALAEASPDRNYEVLVVDGGSSDGTENVAQRHGARVVVSAPGRGIQLSLGASQARGRWLLFLHADTVPEEGWSRAVSGYCANSANRARAAAFRFALDDTAPAARRLEAIVAWRTTALGLPYGDQGLLISRAFYDSIGGFRPYPLMEDVELSKTFRKISKPTLLAGPVILSARRWERKGVARQTLRNWSIQLSYAFGTSPEKLRSRYQS